jgi:hypothetical protein
MNGDGEVLARLQIMEKELHEKLERLRKPLAQAEEELQHVLGTIAILQRGVRPTFTQDTPAEEGLDLNAKLQGMTQMSAVVAIAKSRGGVIQAQDAKKLMIKAGIMSATKNATNMTHNVIARSGLFERIAPGEYRLKDSDQQSGNGRQGIPSEGAPRRQALPLQ